MPQLRTHYDTLKVSRDASLGVIQAAYRSLARQHHPDRQGDSPASEAAMQEINAAYEVLSNPLTRAEHDRWIEAELDADPTRPVFDFEPEAFATPPAADDLSSDQVQSTGVMRAVLSACLALGYWITAVTLLYLPGGRIIGVGMLIAAWLYYRSHHAR
jgi:curved DNA-binding protein CbpA